MAKWLIALLALFPALAGAQTLTFPTDAGTYTARAATYAAGSTPNVLGDGSNDKGGTAPAFTTYPEPTDPTDKTIAAWATAGWVVSDSSVCTTGVPNLAACAEKKFRIHINPAGFFFDDPIKYYGQPGVSHCHEKFGNIAVNAWTTRASLRVRLSSTAAGGNAWSTGYWEPCWEKTIAGKLYAMPAQNNAFYYEEDPPSLPLIDDLQMPHLLFRFIFATNMSDPMDAGIKAEIAAANAQPGTSGRYSYQDNGFNGYQCASPDGGTIRALKAGYTSAPGFTLSDGTDPWEGRCVNGDLIYADAQGRPCWDGRNVSAPNGMDHLRPLVRDNTLGVMVCPNGWYKVPTAHLKTAHQTHGWTDYSTWTLSSDAMAAVTCTALGQTCPTTVPGWSFHADWMNGISRNMRDQIFSFCLGIGTNTPHQCDVATLGATISATQALIYGNSPDGLRQPQVNMVRTVDSNAATALTLLNTRQAKHKMKGM